MAGALAVQVAPGQLRNQSVIEEGREGAFAHGCQLSGLCLLGRSALYSWQTYTFSKVFSARAEAGTPSTGHVLSVEKLPMADEQVPHIHGHLCV